MIRHVVWDWNGTLLGDTSLTVHAARAALGAIGHPVDLTVDWWRQIAARPLSAAYDVLAGHPLDLEQWKIVEKVWLTTYLSGLHSVGLNPGASDALNEVSRRGMTQSIVSLHLEHELRAHVEALGIDGLFTHISGSPGTSWAGERPSKTAVVLSQLAQLSIEPHETLMIGDMTDDAREAKEAGAMAVLVPMGDTSKERLVASGYPVADSFAEALSLVGV